MDLQLGRVKLASLSLGMVLCTSGPSAIVRLVSGLCCLLSPLTWALFLYLFFFPTANFLKRQREVCESGRTSTHGWPTLAFPSSKPQSIISYPSCPADPVLQTTNQMFSSYKCLKLMIR